MTPKKTNSIPSLSARSPNAILLLLSAAPLHEKSPCVPSDTEGELTPRYHLVFAAPFRAGLRILSYPLRCIGRPRLSYYPCRIQITAPESISDKQLRLPRTSRQLSVRIICTLLDLHHCTAIVLRKQTPVKGRILKEQETNNHFCPNTFTSRRRPSRTDTRAVSPGSTSLLMPY